MSALQSELAELRETIQSHKEQANLSGAGFWNHKRLRDIYRHDAATLQEIHDLCKRGKFKEAFELADWVKPQIPKGLWEKMKGAE
jgi:hypothetical protein